MAIRETSAYIPDPTQSRGSTASEGGCDGCVPDGKSRCREFGKFNRAFRSGQTDRRNRRRVGPSRKASEGMAAGRSSGIGCRSQEPPLIPPQAGGDRTKSGEPMGRGFAPSPVAGRVGVGCARGRWKSTHIMAWGVVAPPAHGHVGNVHPQPLWTDAETGSGFFGRSPRHDVEI